MHRRYYVGTLDVECDGYASCSFGFFGVLPRSLLESETKVDSHMLCLVPKYQLKIGVNKNICKAISKGGCL